MKKFKKDDKILTKDRIIIRKNGKQTINPTEEMILDDGWVEYVIPELTEDQQLRLEIAHKQQEIEHLADELKSFTLNGEECTFDTETLNKMTFRVMAELAMNINQTTLWFNNRAYKFKTKDAMELLYKLLIYSGECFDVTSQHKKDVSELKSKDDVRNYKHRDKYPDRVDF